MIGKPGLHSWRGAERLTDAAKAGNRKGGSHVAATLFKFLVFPQLVRRASVDRLQLAGYWERRCPRRLVGVALSTGVESRRGVMNVPPFLLLTSFRAESQATPNFVQGI